MTVCTCSIGAMQNCPIHGEDLPQMPITLSLRDWFAGMALIGIKSNKELCHICSQVEGMTQQEAVAHMAYVDADAMLKERMK